MTTAEAQSTFSMALNARVAWAKFVVALVASEGVSSKAVDELAEEAGDLAEHLGYMSYPDAEMPCLISDVPALIQRWSDGYGHASQNAVFCARISAELEVMWECPGCNDGTGNPCITHG